VYEAGPTGFGLARVARAGGIDVRVIAPGSIPKGPGDRVKTDRRDAIRMVRRLAAGELRFAFVPTIEDEAFRDLIRCIEDVRGDLMRARHRLSKFLLRRGRRYDQARAWSRSHERWLRALGFDDGCSHASFADYLAGVELLAGRRATLLEVLEAQIPECSHAQVIAWLRCFRGIDTLSAAGLCAEVGSFKRFPRPTLMSGFLGIVPSERTSDLRRRQGAITQAGPGHARRLLVEAAHHYNRPPTIGLVLARRQQGQDPRVIEIAWRAQRGCTNAGSTCAPSVASPLAWSRSRSPASSPDSSGRPRPLTDRRTPTIAPGTLRGRARATRKAHRRSRPARLLWATGPGRPRPLLESEPRRIPGLEVAKPSNISLTQQSTRLDLPPVPPRQRPSSIRHSRQRRPALPATGQPPYQ
jgi:transposase